MSSPSSSDAPRQEQGFEPASSLPGTPFPYAGNKTRLAKWIIQNMRDHDLFVAPFAGAGGILFNKKPSRNEVINDINGDITTFYRVLRDSHAELDEYLQLIPYSEEQYKEWKEKWDRGWRPSDDIKHAAVFYFLQRSSFGAAQTGFRAIARGRKNSSQQFYNSLTRLSDFSERLRGVIIHNRDYADLMDKYGNHERALFYFDPPYTSASDHYDAPDFPSGRFASLLGEFSGEYDADWLLSSMHVPLSVRCYPTLETDLVHQINNTSASSPTERTEKLTCSYDPSSVHIFNGESSSQTTFGAFSTNDLENP